MKVESAMNKDFSITINKSGESWLAVLVKNELGDSISLTINKKEFMRKLKEEIVK